MPTIKVEHATAAPKGDGKLVQSSGIKDETNAREWGERQGLSLVYFNARKQRAWGYKPAGAKQAALEPAAGIDEGPTVKRAPKGPRPVFDKPDPAAKGRPLDFEQPDPVIPEEADLHAPAPDPDYPADVEAIRPEDVYQQTPVDPDPKTPRGFFEPELTLTTDIDVRISGAFPIAPARTTARLDHILPNAQQPRGDEDPETVATVARSIAAVGLQQVPAARSVKGRPGYYELVFGHTRLAAFRLLAAGKIPGADPARFQEMPLDVAPRDDRAMFVEAVHENVDRADLTVIDLARVADRAMNVYGMTSAEAGALINKAASTVRNLVRFLELPKDAQEKLARGELTENDARALLSIQKVAPSKAVSDVIKSIEKKAGAKHPDEVIDRALAELDHKKALVQMWDDSRDGEPRGIRWSSWAWPLNTVKFPLERLPAITQANLITAIGSEKIDDVIRLVHLVHSEGEFDIALEGLKLADEAKAKIRNLVRPPACTACAFYTKIRGSHYCGFKLCHDRKVEAWTAETIARAGERLKIPVYKRSDGEFRLLDNYNRVLFDKRDPALRLIPSELYHGEKYFHNFLGVDHDIFCVVVVGEKLKSLEKAAASSGSYPRAGGGKLTDAEKLKRRKNLIFRRAYKAIIWEFTAAGAHLFEPLTLDALQIIAGWEMLTVDAFPPDDAREGKENDPAYWRRLIIWKMVNDRQDIGFMSLDSFGMKTPAGELVMVLSDLAKNCGFKVPKAVVKMAADVDAEIAAVRLTPAPTTKKPAPRKITPAPKPTSKGSKK